MADVDESVKFGPVGAGAAETAAGSLYTVYSATKAGATDTVTFSNLSAVDDVIATNDGTGALDPVTDITTNVVTLSVGTGATTLRVWGRTTQ